MSSGPQQRQKITVAELEILVRKIGVVLGASGDPKMSKDTPVRRHLREAYELALSLCRRAGGDPYR